MSNKFKDAWPKDNETLCEALSMGGDYSGVVTFEEVQIITASKRFQILSSFRLEDGRYEVILQGDSGAWSQMRRARERISDLQDRGLLLRR